MNNLYENKFRILQAVFLLGVLSISGPPTLLAQEATEEEQDNRPIRPPFESAILIDNQTSVVPTHKTLQFNIQHRFGAWNNDIEDLFGLWAPSNIRLAMSYTILPKLSIGIGGTKNGKVVDFNAKYSIRQQTRSGSFPVGIAYYVNAAVSTLSESNFFHTTDRYSYFHQLIISRRLNSKISVQLAPSVSHFNFVSESQRDNDHYAISGSGRYRFSSQSSVIINVDQPLSAHRLNNPNPNISFGAEISTGSHAFQIFFGNYSALIPQQNNMYNANDYRDNEFLIGFNITRLWNF